MEIWKDIKGYEGLYQVSNEGRIKSLPRKWVAANGGTRSHNGIILAQANGTKGYKVVNLAKDGSSKTYKVHRLVAEAFIDNPKHYPMINHKDECKDNNFVENLEWCDNAYNIRYGNRTKKSSKVVYQFTLDGQLLKQYDSASDAARLNNYSSIGNISSCCLGLMKTYKGYKWSYKPL